MRQLVCLICASLLATSALLLQPNAVQADETYYQWIDDKGRPVHSDRPPPKGVEYEVVSTQSKLVRPVDAETGAVPKKIEPTPGNDFNPVQSGAPAVAKNPEYCDRARENLSRLDTDARIRMRDEQGEVRFLDEQQRAVERQKALDSINAYCE